MGGNFSNMVDEHITVQKLLDLSAAEIDQLSGGCFSDDDILTAADQLPDLEDQTKARAKQLALLKLTWRSPEVDDWYAYEDVLYDILNGVIENENGKDFLYWALAAIIFFARPKRGSFPFDHYWDFARGFLYQGRVRIFLRFIDALLARTQLPDYGFGFLIEDAARLGAKNLAEKLQALAEKRYGVDWHAIAIDDLLEAGKVLKVHPAIAEEQQKAILGRLSLASLADPHVEVECWPLISTEQIQSLLSENQEPENYLLLVPDIIHTIFNAWEEQRELCAKFLKMLNAVEDILPELSILGDLLYEDPQEVFLFESFGKTAGFTINSVKSFAVNPEYNNNLRMNAARALMQIAEKAPRCRSQVIETMKHLLDSQENDTLQGDQRITFIAADLLDTDLYELKPEVARIFQEDRVDPQVVDLDSFVGRWSLPGLTDTVDDKSMLLRCQQCKQTCRHPYEAIIFDISMRGRHPEFTPLEIFVDHPIICPRCGAKDSYTVVLQSMLRLIPPQFFTEDDEPIPYLDEAVYILFSERLFLDGLSPFMFSTLRKQVIDSGLESLDLLGRGEYLRVIGKFQESLQAFRQFYAENPNSQSGALALAMAEHDYGNRQLAKTYYQRSLVLGQGNLGSQIEDPRLEAAMHGLDALEQGARSPYLYPINKFQKTLLDQQNRDRRHKRH